MNVAVHINYLQVSTPLETTLTPLPSTTVPISVPNTIPPYVLPTPAPCRSCGRCPTCGHYKEYPAPVIPWTAPGNLPFGTTGPVWHSYLLAQNSSSKEI